MKNPRIVKVETEMEVHDQLSVFFCNAVGTGIADGRPFSLSCTLHGAIIIKFDDCITQFLFPPQDLVQAALKELENMEKVTNEAK